ncbi:ecdysis triggering hormone [Halictus rubicundus]|uniref:ecdysis triggering hormone n=1 Tax=Halictus rubicundus TaxID=77578 RepID=UPI004036D570
MLLLRSSVCGRSYFVSVVLVGTFVMLISQNATKADEVPAFFLKIAKNIPRVGRSDGYEDLLLKSRKNTAKYEGHSGSQPESWSSYTNEDPFSGPIKRRMDYPSVDDAQTWQDFPLRIGGSLKLWRTLAGYSEEADDIDNEIWKRSKRTGNEAVDFQGN